MTADIPEVQADLTTEADSATTEVITHFHALIEPGLHGLFPDDMIPYVKFAGIATIVLGVLLIISLIMGIISIIWRIQDSKFKVSRYEVRKMARKAMLEKQKEDSSSSTGITSLDDESDDIKKG